MRVSVFLVLALRLLGPMVFCSAADALTISWGDLKNAVARRPVVVDVANAGVLRGSLLDQDEAGVLLSVKSASPRGDLEKYQNVRVERTKIARFLVVKDPKRTRGRWLLGIAGYVAGGAIGAATGGDEQDPRLLLGLAGGAVLGYYTGKSLDKSLLELHILSDGENRTAGTANSAKTRPFYLRRESSAVSR